MSTDLIFSHFLLVALLWLCVLVYVLWPDGRSSADSTLPQPTPPRRKRSQAPQPFAGLLPNPLCDACERATALRPQPPSSPPPVLTFTRGRKHTIDTQQQFGPDQDCASYGWTGRGNLRANGHPGSKRGRPLQCVSGLGYFQQTHGTPFHGKQVSPPMLVWAVGALAEGLGIRAVARVFEGDPHTVWAWLVEGAEHAAAFSQYFLHDVRGTQVHLDELFALLSAVKTAEVSEAAAIQRWARSPPWVWVAIAPITQLLRTIAGGDRPLAMAQRVVHQVVPRLAPDCAPLLRTAGFKEYTTALLTPYGHWIQPERRQVKGPEPKPRWMPLPQLRYAQVVKTVRRRRLVGVTQRGVFGTLGAVEQGLAPLGWQITTALVERINLDSRQHIAAVGRRVTTRCKGEAGLRQQLAL